MKWVEVEPDIKAQPISDYLSGISAVDIISFVSRHNRDPFVLFEPSVRSKILSHLRTENVELGGLLLGNVVSDHSLQDGIVVIRVTDSVASEEFESSSVSLRMDSSVWQKANAKLREDFFVVGWYHSHPNLGAFFSGTDRRTQLRFFNQKYHLGLVIDPIRNEEKWFLGADSKEISCDQLLSSTEDIFRKI